MTPSQPWAGWWHRHTVLERSPDEELGAARTVEPDTTRLVRLVRFD